MVRKDAGPSASNSTTKEHTDGDPQAETQTTQEALSRISSDSGICPHIALAISKDPDDHADHQGLIIVLIVVLKRSIQLERLYPDPLAFGYLHHILIHLPKLLGSSIVVVDGSTQRSTELLKILIVCREMAREFFDISLYLLCGFFYAECAESIQDRLQICRKGRR